MDEVRIIAATQNTDDISRLRSLLSGEEFHIVAAVRPGAGGLARAGNTPADALVIYCAGAADAELDFAQRIYMTREDLAIVIIAGEVTADTIDRAMVAGVSRVIPAAIEPSAVREAVLSAVNREKNRAAAGKSNASTYDSRIIQFFSPKGGVGKTTLAVNAAAALAARGKKTAVVDLDLQFGDVGVFLDIAKADTIADMVEENNFDPKTVRSYMVRHYSGLDVLLGSASPEYAELVKPEHIEKLLGSLRGEYDYLVLDMPPAFTDCAIAAMESSDTVFFAVTEEISSLRCAKTSFKVMEALNLADKLELVVNKDGISNISVKDVERTLEKKAALSLPFDQKTATRAINRGVPVVIGDKHSRMAKAMEQFAKKLTER